VKTCDEYLNAIGELVDGTLGPIRRAELELHLESCDQCRALVGDLLQIARTSRALDATEPPAHVWNGIAGTAAGRGPGTASPRGGSAAATPCSRSRRHSSSRRVRPFVLMVRDPGQTARRPLSRSTCRRETSVFDDPVQSVATELALTERHFQNAIEQVDQVRRAREPGHRGRAAEEPPGRQRGDCREPGGARGQPRQHAGTAEPVRRASKQKIQFLQDTIALMNVMRQGTTPPEVDGRSS
jgi:hypothetical protein